MRREQACSVPMQGQQGAKQLVATSSERLVCGRDRHGPRRKTRRKPVEIIVAERDREPPRPRVAADQSAGVRVAREEVDRRERVKPAGGTWNRPRRGWQLSHGDAIAPAPATGLSPNRHLPADAPALSGKHLHADAGEASR